MVLALLAFTLAATGCGGPYDSRVSGSVTLDGQPLKVGTVTFHPDQSGPAAYGRIATDGSYQLNTGSNKGLPAGAYTVTVVATDNPPPAKQGGTPPIGKLITPRRYGLLKTTDLKYTIEAGSNQIDIVLTSASGKE